MYVMILIFVLQKTLPKVAKIKTEKEVDDDDDAEEDDDDDDEDEDEDDEDEDDDDEDDDGEEGKLQYNVFIRKQNILSFSLIMYLSQVRQESNGYTF